MSFHAQICLTLLAVEEPQTLSPLLRLIQSLRDICTSGQELLYFCTIGHVMPYGKRGCLSLNSCVSRPHYSFFGGH